MLNLKLNTCKVHKINITLNMYVDSEIKYISKAKYKLCGLRYFQSYDV